MAFSENDFLKVEYTAWRIADGKIVYTTDDALAKKEEIFDENVKYGPQLVVLKSKGMMKGMKRELLGMSVNEVKKFELEPADAFGERNSDMVRVMSINDFRKRDIEPYPGMKLDLDGSIATIKSVNSGRVVVDANHPLAGERLRYELKVIGKVDGNKEKAEELMRHYDLKGKVSGIDKGVMSVDVEDAKDTAEYFANKATFVNSALDYIDGISKIRITEEYAKKQNEEKPQNNES
jgi:FKBP-type peptidyl-prolyl cis-trans isomerase 2